MVGVRPRAHFERVASGSAPSRRVRRLAAQRELDACALLAAADHREAERVGRRREQLVVLAEADVVERRARRRAGRARARSRGGQPERCAMWPASAREPVGDVEHRGRDRARAASLPRRGSGGRRSRPVAERGAGGAERPGHDERGRPAALPRGRVRARSARARSRDRTTRSARRRVAAAHRHAALVQALRRARARRRASSRAAGRARRGARAARLPRRRGR